MDPFSVYNSIVRDRGINAEEIFGCTGTGLWTSAERDSQLTEAEPLDMVYFSAAGSIGVQQYSEILRDQGSG